MPYELPLEKQVQRQARPRAVFSQLNPGHGLGIASGLAGHSVPGINSKHIGIRPTKMADGGEIDSSDSYFDPAATEGTPDSYAISEQWQPQLDLSGGIAPSLKHSPTGDAYTSPEASRTTVNPDGSLSYDQSGEKKPSDGQSGSTGFGGWMQNKHAGIKGEDWLKAGLTALTGILSGVAAKKANIPRMGSAPQVAPVINAGHVGVPGFAQGGQVGGQGSTQQDQMIAAAAVKAALGQSSNPQQALAAFASRFGPDAVKQLMAQVAQAKGGGQQQAPSAQQGMNCGGMYANGGILSGPGTGMSDDIPANGGQIALSSGEFLIPADAVSQLGDGSSEAGARKLHQGIASLRQQKYGHTKQPKKLPHGSNPVLGQ